MASKNSFEFRVDFFFFFLIKLEFQLHQVWDGNDLHQLFVLTVTGSLCVSG
jgi:hypothetical protein